MKKYLNADLYRIFTRIPRWVMLFLVMLVVSVLFWPDKKSEATIIELVDLLQTTLKYVPVYMGFIEMIYIFGDDFAGKTAQIAIGTGVKRNEIIFAKFLEILIVVFFDAFVISAWSLILSAIQTHVLPAELVFNIIAHMIVSVLATGAFMSLVFPIMFAMQNISVALLIYTMLAAGAINKIVNLIVTYNKFLRRFNLESFTLSNCLNVFRSRMILGSFKVESILGIVLYIGIFLWLTSVVYKKRELDF